MARWMHPRTGPEYRALLQMQPMLKVYRGPLTQYEVGRMYGTNRQYIVWVEGGQVYKIPRQAIGVLLYAYEDLARKYAPTESMQ